jgi:hypothetical protein
MSEDPLLIDYLLLLRFGSSEPDKCSPAPTQLCLHLEDHKEYSLDKKSVTEHNKTD